MTPPAVARFMASLFPDGENSACRLLDPGAGTGALTCAFLDRSVGEELRFSRVDVEAFEIDDALRSVLTETISPYTEQSTIKATTFPGDFILAAVTKGLARDQKFTHAILNPPYKKIRNNSEHRHLLRKLGIETVNLYSAFVALSLELLAPGGQLVAITPRSFCNGPYYRRFRQFVLERAAIHHIHLFDARDKAFKDDSVLQENVIFRIGRGAKQGKVVVSTSTDDRLSDYSAHSYPFGQIVSADDPDRFIHVPTSTKRSLIRVFIGSSTFAQRDRSSGVDRPSC